MSRIIEALWNEPAVFIGFVTSVAILALKLLAGGGFGVEDVAAVLAPLGAGTAIRTQVSPADEPID